MPNRSFSQVFSDIIANTQEIIRGEILLARIEALDEVARAKKRIALVGSGIIAMIFAIVFLLISAFQALMQVLPAWTAALIVAAVMTLLGVLLLNDGMRDGRDTSQISPSVQSAKENLS